MTLRTPRDRRKKSFIQKILAFSERNEKKTTGGFLDSSDFQSDSAAETSFLSSSEEPPMPSGQHVQSLSVFVATWNVGGKSPRIGINLDDFLQLNHSSDMYVLGFQEIVPLNAGNVLVIEDNEPASRWLASINQSLNKQVNTNSRGPRLGGSLFFPKPSLKSISKTFRTESSRRLKSCNCTPYELERKRSKDLWFRCQTSPPEDNVSSEEDDDESTAFDVSGISIEKNANQMKYSLVACKQMVGIFVTIWMKKELVPHISHLRISCVSRGIMGCLGNKGCISVSMLFHQTSFCFICSHLASGEKEGDELRRNSDVIEILKNTQFSKIRRPACSRMPEKIAQHDRVIWLGDLNYRIALSFSETRRLMEENLWEELLNKDQLRMEMEAGRVFAGWKEGKIYFAPTYKYYYNSDAYAADVKKSKKYRRTPAWCDRILWHGNGIRQISYLRGESRFSDHRPVCAAFSVDVLVLDCESQKGLSRNNTRIAIEELLPQSNGYCH